MERKNPLPNFHTVKRASSERPHTNCSDPGIIAAQAVQENRGCSLSINACSRQRSKELATSDRREAIRHSSPEHERTVQRIM
jgi:hypothetical protein